MKDTEMKNTILVMLAVLIVIAPVQVSADAAAAAGPRLNMSLLKYEPVPAYPGDVLDVWVKLDNLGGDVASGVVMEFIDNYPFTLESDQTRTHRVGAIAGGYDYVAKFTVRVDSSVSAGTSYLKARYMREGSTSVDSWKEILIPIDIKSRVSSLSIESIEIPDSLEPGQRGMIKIVILNNQDSLVRDVSVKLDLDSSSAPIAPVQSATELKIKEMQPGEEREFVFNVIAELDASANAYRIPLNVSFKDDTGAETSYSDLIGVVISSKPDLVMTIDSADIYTDKTNDQVTLKFVNKGIDEIKFLYFELPPSDTYDLLSPTNKYYVGNIDSDDYELEDISIRALDTDSLEIPLIIEYRDATNKVYEVEETLSMNLVSRESISEEEGGNGTLIFFLVVAAAGGFYWWRKKKK